MQVIFLPLSNKISCQIISLSILLTESCHAYYQLYYDQKDII